MGGRNLCPSGLCQRNPFVVRFGFLGLTKDFQVPVFFGDKFSTNLVLVMSFRCHAITAQIKRLVVDARRIIIDFGKLRSKTRDEIGIAKDFRVSVFGCIDAELP